MLTKYKTRSVIKDRDSVLQEYRCSFVTARSVNETTTPSVWQQKPFNENVTGNEIKEFYENLVKEDSRKKFKRRVSETTNNVNKRLTKVKVKEEINEEISRSTDNDSFFTDPVTVRQLVNNLLRASSSGNKTNVIQCVENIRGYADFFAILNGRDEFGWNALMCAAAEGHLNVVKYLVKEGCEYKNVSDNSGMNVFSICELKNHFEVYVYLSDLENKYRINRKSEIVCETGFKNDITGDTFLKCNLCDLSFLLSERTQHESSVIHIFNDKNKVVNDIYGIPDHNIGFQMMLRSGWKSSGGLGPDGSGRKNPVKSVIKQNRHGLGLVKNDPKKQFHFEPFKNHDILNNKTIQRNHENENHKEKNKAWEINMRRYMSSDF